MLQAIRSCTREVTLHLLPPPPRDPHLVHDAHGTIQPEAKQPVCLCCRPHLGQQLQRAQQYPRQRCADCGSHSQVSFVPRTIATAIRRNIDLR